MKSPLKNILNSLVIGLLLFSCTNSNKKDEEYIQLKSYLDKKNKSIENYKYLMVLSDKGECLTCSKKYASFLKSFINRDSTLLILVTKGNTIDISGLLDAENKVLDISQNFYKLGLTNNSAFIELTSSEIDSVLEVKINTINESLHYISNRYRPK